METGKYLYFDAAATEMPCDEAKEAVLAAMEEYGNPSSGHCAGFASRELVEKARETVASAVGCAPEELYFTGSGTEASNIAIRGLAKLRGRISKTVLTTDSEHPSVREPLKALESEGFQILRLSTRNGVIPDEEIDEACRQPLAFVTVMQANNETGAVYDLMKIRRALADNGNDAPVHCDAVQSFLKIRRNRLPSFCDLATVSGHKVGGLKGTGALYVRKNIRIPALILGGGQEQGMRSGTENVPGIASFGAAVRAKASDPGRFERMERFHDELAEAVRAMGYVCHVPEAHLPNILHIQIPGVRSSWAVNALSAMRICVSAGSACSTKKKDNPVLTAYGLTREESETSLRISFTETADDADLHTLVEALKKIGEMKR